MFKLQKPSKQFKKLYAFLFVYMSSMKSMHFFMVFLYVHIRTNKTFTN